MRIIPVIDVKGGLAVHARGGDRAHYAPIRSILHEGHDPVDLARAYRDRLGLDSVYLADLDAIAGGVPNVDVYRRIAELPMTLWIDAGVRDGVDGVRLLEAGASVVIAGLETLRGPEALGSLVERLGRLSSVSSVADRVPLVVLDQCGPGHWASTTSGTRHSRPVTNRVAFSLDLRNGQPLGSWGIDDPREIAAIAVGLGVTRLIVLDLARVGMGVGVGTLSLISALRADHPNIEIVAGGGVAGPDDLRRLVDAGATAALVGSALHDGRIGRMK